MSSLASPRITFIGGGNMAQALITGLRQRDFAMQQITVIDPDASKHDQLQQALGVRTAQVLSAKALQVDVIVLAVKPQQLKTVAESLAPYLQSQLVISVAAGIRTTDLSRWLNGYSTLIRTMPNTPAQIQAGVTGIYALASVSEGQRLLADSLLQAAGDVVWLTDEAQLDAVTAISGSGPAYVFLLIEALTDAGVALGLDKDQALQLSVATFKGASLLAAASETPIATLREQVTSKGGTTEQGLLSLNQHNIHAIMQHAAQQAANRAKTLGDELGGQ
ncbi:pyrroline-5-carboxylate reductase [Methylophilus sp. Leaf414]|uniref:pyrroline-5-carboxylate reductase n=1 Tax=Methylophilus sp. Leaf414 TaxID=1736371 RepID=UPI0006F45154|nr:pyrroline-5-carboxylate reductase [Methylophilus sp. Leaf414]KQT37929.1 pyrroline-5-carboxylate reductase [Methylophilus sp. Leaf414]